MHRHGLLFLLFLGATLPATAHGPAQGNHVQHQGDGGIEELKAALQRPGPEAAEARQAAIDSLLAMMELKAHVVLHEKLRAPLGTDGLHREILGSLARRLRNPGDRVFGTGEENKEARQQIVRSYVPALVGFWLQPAAGAEATAAELREHARGCVTRMPMRELDEGLRALVGLPTQDVAMRVAALYAAADARDLYLATFLADQIANEDVRVRVEARKALKLLTFADEEFASVDQFRGWWERNKGKRYLDLAEEAGRASDGRLLRVEAEYRARLVQGAVDLVVALSENRSGIDWAAVQARVILDEPLGTTDACLERLAQRLRDELHGDHGTRERQAFHRSLVETFGKTAPANKKRRGLLLETAAYLLRPGEGELATEMEKSLIQQLEGGDDDLAIMAVRALSRFPTQSSRTALVKVARSAMQEVGDGRLPLLREALLTLGRRSNPPWTAPGEADADRVGWLALVRTLFTSEGFKDLRPEAMAMARMPDSKGERVPEVFDALLALAKDQTQGFEVRTQSLIHVKDFVSMEDRADTFVRALALLLADPDKEVRLFAASQLTSLPDQSEARRREWIELVSYAARDRLKTESNAGVVRALVSCLAACARPPGTSDRVISLLLGVLDDLGYPVPVEQQLRTEPLLHTLTALAAEPMSEPGPWLGACRMLKRHEKRRSLRHVLQSQHAARLAGETVAADAGVAERARLAMQLILDAAVLKPGKDSWAGPELRDEANDVRSAMVALDAASADLSAPALRMLRLEVLSALSLHQELLQHTSRFLSPDDKPKGGVALSAEQKDQVRLLAAEAHLALNQFDRAGTLLGERDAARATEPATVALMERLGKALLDGGASPKALPWLERALQATAEAEPRYRHRLLATAQARIQAHPESKVEVAELLDSKAALFEAADCPPELKEAFTRLRGQGR